MMSTLNPHDDRDALSALFDGELHGDAARFALKRLAHDGQWRETCSRWQLVGDALRGRATAAAPTGFADGVSARLARDAAPAPVVSIAEAAASRGAGPTVVAAPRRRWLGGAALAASVAMAALFVSRPFSSGEPADAPAPVVAASTAPSPIETSATGAAPAATSAAALAATGAVAVSEAPRRVSERRSRGQSQRAALRVQQRAASAPVVINAAAAEPVLVASAAPATTVDPFRPQPADAIVTRPWPRAALPNFPATGTLTASAGSSVAAPSFYPFEPRLQAEEPAGSADAAGPQP